MNAIPNLATMPGAVTPYHIAIITAVVRRDGGHRERAIMDAPHTIERTETWNAAHKVLEILSTQPDPDGYRPGFAIDIETRSICG